MFNGILQIRSFIGISLRCLKTLIVFIGLFNSDTLLISKFGNSEFDFDKILSIIKKTRMLADLEITLSNDMKLAV